MSENKDTDIYKKQKVTLLLTGETIALIKEFGLEHLGSKSVSGAVRAMAIKYGKEKSEG